MILAPWLCICTKFLQKLTMVQKFFQTQNLFYWQFGETLGLLEVRDAQRAIAMAEAAELPVFCRYFDMSLIKKVDLNLSDVVRLAVERKAKLPIFEGSAKSAVYAPSKFLYEIASLYQSFLGDSNIQLGVFQEQLDIENWLRIPIKNL